MKKCISILFSLLLLTACGSENDLWDAQSDNGDYDMALSEGPNAPSTVVDTREGPDGNEPWTTPNNVVSSNNAYAQKTLSGTANYLDVTNFSFNIPLNAVILGVEARVERKDRGGNVSEDSELQLIVGGSTVGEDKADTGVSWPGVDTVKTYGGPTDLWGLNLTPQQVNASNFGFSILVLCAPGTPDIDFMSLQVYYIVPGEMGGDF